MKEQEKNLPEQIAAQQDAGFSADALVIGVTAGLVLGAVTGFLTGRITLCLPLGILMGLAVGYVVDRRRDRAAGITSSPLSFWTTEKNQQIQENPLAADAPQQDSQQTADEPSQQQTEE